MTLTANAQVQKVIYDSKTGKAAGARYVDTVSGETTTVTARIVFMCTSTLGSVQILMNSTSDKYPMLLAIPVVYSTCTALTARAVDYADKQLKAGLI